MKSLQHVSKLFVLSILVFASALFAQQGPPEHVRKAITALTDFASTTGDEAVARFVAEQMTGVSTADRPSVEAELKRIREALKGKARSPSVEREPDGIKVTYRGDEGVAELKVLIEPAGITRVKLVSDDGFANAPPSTEPEQLNQGTKLTESSLETQFNKYAESGLSGNVYVAVGGRTLLKASYGTANKEFRVPIRFDTIFGIGSTPISFTIASVYLLEQEGKLDQDDPVSKYLADVPRDKHQMTLRHLMTGGSGLPDFHDTESDWDADLAWIDRDTAVARILTQPLIFEPGTGNQHSHSAFVLLAAIIEIVSGNSYASFLETNLFKPAGMTRTGMYGEARDFGVKDFAEGNGRSAAGVPNIPPNWGPTSWLVMGSGGMYSTMDDLLRFHEFISSRDRLQQRYVEHFNRAAVTIGGSARGFFVFIARNAKGDMGIMMLNVPGMQGTQRQAVFALGEFIRTR